MSQFSKVKKILSFLDQVPEKYKTGPWSPLIHIYLCTIVGILLVTLPTAIDSLDSHHNLIKSASDGPSDFLQNFRLCVGCYALCVSSVLVYFAGFWPFMSYTLTSWNLMTFRLLSAWGGGRGNESMQFIAETLRFPALVGCTITVCVWWGLLVPLISWLLRGSTEKTVGFWYWNFSPMLINIHLLNLPIIGIDFVLSGSPLGFFDLWMGFFVGIMYILFYLNVLDRLGLHFYIILTPRTGWTVLTYSGILGLYYAVYCGWNASLSLTPPEGGFSDLSDLSDLSASLPLPLLS